VHQEFIRDPITVKCQTIKEGALEGVGNIQANDNKVEQLEVVKTIQHEDFWPCLEVTSDSTPPLGIVIHGGLFVFPTSAMKTKGKGRTPIGGLIDLPHIFTPLIARNLTLNP